MTPNNSSRLQYRDGLSGELVTVPAIDPKTALAFSKLVHGAGHKAITFQKFENGEWTFDAVTTGKHNEKVKGVDSPDHRAHTALVSLEELAKKLAKATAKASLTPAQLNELGAMLMHVLEASGVSLPTMSLSMPIPSQKPAAEVPTLAPEPTPTPVVPTSVLPAVEPIRATVDTNERKSGGVFNRK